MYISKMILYLVSFMFIKKKSVFALPQFVIRVLTIALKCATASVCSFDDSWSFRVEVLKFEQPLKKLIG